MLHPVVQVTAYLVKIRMVRMHLKCMVLGFALCLLIIVFCYKIDAKTWDIKQKSN